MQQRLRVMFARGEELKYISHLDMMRLWHRALRRAGVPVAYSEGYTPRPRLSLASALPVGVTSEAELLDVYLRRRMSPFYFLKLVSPQLPKGVEIKEAQDVSVELPSLQSQVSQAEYMVLVETQDSPDKVREAIDGLMALKTLPWEHKREDEVRRYDLRALIHRVWLEGPSNGQLLIGMLLKADSTGSGRPEQVVAALGLPVPPARIHRLRLVLAEELKKAGAR